MRKLFAIDYSTESSGYAVYDIENKKLLTFGVVKGRHGKGNNKLVKTLGRLKNMADDLVGLIDEEVEDIVIEEINASKSRKGQKTLDGGHFILQDRMGELLRKVHYMDTITWRGILKLEFTLQQKLHNQQLRKLNKQLRTKLKEKDIITKKDLCVDFVNRQFGLSLTMADNDSAEAIGLGWAYLNG